MRAYPLMAAIFTLAIAGVRGQGLSADSGRGKRLFETLGCIQCHSVNGKGAAIAPDLGKRLGRNHSPADLTALMWNHAPTMWSAMSRQGVRIPRISEQVAADLFAYFYAARYFEHPADAARGKALFSSEHCAGCHGLTAAKPQGGKPVRQWDSLDHPVALVAAMWSHAQYMSEALSNRLIIGTQVTYRALPHMETV
jgi:mono/diheme cytochrome c family protein